MVIEKVAKDSLGRNITSLVQWDTDVYIYIEDSNITKAYPVHFSNGESDYSFVVEATYTGGKLKAKIPNILLHYSKPIVAFVYVDIDGGNRSVYRTRINVIAKPMPDNVVFEETVDYVTVESLMETLRTNVGDVYAMAADLIISSDEEPTSEYNKIWVTDYELVELMTKEDLANHVITATSDGSGNVSLSYGDNM